MKEDKNLNKQQLQAIRHKKGPLLIIAGAGTGKTTIVTERVKHLIVDQGVKPSEILALTFTEKAAREMETRVDVALPYGLTQMWISTFHSFCDRLLRAEALHIGLDPSYKLMTEAENVAFIRRNLFAFDFSYFRPLGNPNKFVSGLLTHFSRLQDENITPSEYVSWVKEQDIEDEMELKKLRELSSAYRTYEELKVREGVFDYGDLITKTLKLFLDRPNILSQYQKQFQHILVDEFQDTNFAQNELVTLLAKKHKNIAAIGDDDQSIYKFRGASISNILQFRKNFPTAKVIVLTKNYRSNQTILDAAYKLIQNNNPDRLEYVENVNKKLQSQRGTEGIVQFIHKDRSENEADAVAKKIIELVEEGYEYKDVAVLVRANNHAESFIKSFQRNGIPYQFLGPARLFKQPEIIFLVSYLKVLYNYADSVAMAHLLSMPELEVPVRDIITIGNFAKREQITFFESCERLNEISLPPNTSEKIIKIIKIINKHIELSRKKPAGALLYEFLQNMGLLPKLLNPDTPEAQKRAKNIAKFFDKLKTFEVEHEDASVAPVVDWIELATELGESPLATDTDWTEINAVNILTVHSSKGLEFRAVFLTNLVEQRFPTNERSDQIPIPEGIVKEVLPSGDFHLQEERRLFYVGMTRACDALFLTAADYYGEGKRVKKMSQFIFEALGDNVLSAEKEEDLGEQLSLLDYAPALDMPHTAYHIPDVHIDYLSYSQIETFRLCPLHYKLRYILHVSTPTAPAQGFGVSIHASLKNFYEAIKAGERPSVDLLLEKLSDVWIKEGYATIEHEAIALHTAGQYLSEWYKKEFNKSVLPILLEQPFVLDITKKGERPLKIGGVIDRVDQLEENKIEIIDYKTGATVPTQRQVNTNLQLTFYALAATQIPNYPFGKKPNEVKLSLYYFETQTKFSTTRTQAQLEEAKEEIFKMREEIEKSDFTCAKNLLCDNCEYALFCRAEH
jgi:DNA helicase-2/ATP-dependent DNA helicase PcrA